MKSNLDSMFKLDETATKKGVWYNISEETGFLVRPFKPSNPNIKAAFDRNFKPYSTQIAHGKMSQEKERAIMTKIFVEACVEDWKGVEIDGAKAPFTKEACTTLLVKLPELFVTLQKHAEDRSNYLEDYEADDEDVEALGNS